MKLNKFDIGGEIISILTKGMYPDPRDAVREYIQNAVDAKAKEISVKVRQSSVIVEDDGSGMDYETLRKAVRIGISDKNPKKNVGFMGIGIYSSFHLCDTLTIYTRKKTKLPLRLEMNFKAMRGLLNEQKELRLKNKISSDKLIDLQTLLENHISLTNEHELTLDEFPVEEGTRVELVGLDPILDDELSDFNKLASYLRDVIPLHFEKKNFMWGDIIEKKINQICREHNAIFELVNVKLQVNTKTEVLYRPYYNSSFSENAPQEPIFKEIKKDKVFLGVAWGCLNPTRDKIEDRDLRGFIIKKQGFSIVKREKVVQSFGKSSTHFDRYIGEIIVVNNEILPNAARNDFEYSNLRTILYGALTEVGTFYNQASNKFQEENKAESQLEESIFEFKSMLAEFNPNEENPEKLIALIIKLKEIQNILTKKTKRLPKDKQADANSLKIQVKELEKTIQSKINVIAETKKNKTSHTKSQVNIASKLKEISSKGHSFKKYENLVALFDDLDFSIEDRFKNVLFIIDEKFIQALSKNKEEYYFLMNELKHEILNQELD